MGGGVQTLSRWCVGRGRKLGNNVETCKTYLAMNTVIYFSTPTHTIVRLIADIIYISVYLKQ